MPIYEYQCDNCDYTFDLLQKMADPPPIACPECGSGDIRRLISRVGFRLKGAGWYETDFKSDNKRNLHDSGDKAAGDQMAKPAGEGKSADSGASSTSSAPASSAPTSPGGATPSP